ncbi:MAG: hypothetical protein D4R97_09445 [Bacteroidetes bacterium]|nr:MAG: hypothetical protein D4R97_09445 [Bacteroidota bacterium]
MIYIVLGCLALLMGIFLYKLIRGIILSTKNRGQHGRKKEHNRSFPGYSVPGLIYYPMTARQGNI